MADAELESSLEFKGRGAKVEVGKGNPNGRCSSKYTYAFTQCSARPRDFKAIDRYPGSRSPPLETIDDFRNLALQDMYMNAER